MISFSVVVNTHNRAALLEDTLRGLEGLRYPSFEVVVVNGPSTDGTDELLAKWAARIKLVSCAKANLAVSRNLGIAAASGDVIAFIDDDAVPHPDWLNELSYAYADPRVAAVGGFTLDHTGVVFQARKHVCDRFGNSFERPDDFDERVLNRQGGALYPSLLGTNSSFRKSALVAVRGFDPVFAYFLDETDLCLRLVDAGGRVVYAPDALVFHQFAPSAMRDVRRVPRSILQLVISKAYFIWTHGARVSLEEAGRQLKAYEAKMRADNARLFADHAIDAAHRVRLDEELKLGLEQGREAAFARRDAGWLEDNTAEAMREFLSRPKRSLAVITRQVSAELEDGLRHAVAAGGIVHLIHEGDLSRCRFHDSIWRHQTPCEAAAGAALAAKYDIPDGIADWCATAGKMFDKIANFGIDRTAATWREVPGLAVLDRIDVLWRDDSTAAALEAHPEWRERVLFAHFHCGRLIAVENLVAAAVNVATLGDS